MKSCASVERRVNPLYRGAGLPPDEVHLHGTIHDDVQQLAAMF